jgi:hypothetical protein
MTVYRSLRHRGGANSGVIRFVEYLISVLLNHSKFMFVGGCNSRGKLYIDEDPKKFEVYGYGW